MSGLRYNHRRLRLQQPTCWRLWNALLKQGWLLVTAVHTMATASTACPLFTHHQQHITADTTYLFCSFDSQCELC